jgi:hypothetical protein
MTTLKTDPIAYHIMLHIATFHNNIPNGTVSLYSCRQTQWLLTLRGRYEDNE